MRDDRLIVAGMVVLTLGWATMQRDTKTKDVSPIAAAVTATQHIPVTAPTTQPPLPPMPSTFVGQRTFNFTAGYYFAPSITSTSGVLVMQPPQAQP